MTSLRTNWLDVQPGSSSFNRRRFLLCTVICCQFRDLHLNLLGIRTSIIPPSEKEDESISAR